MVCIPIVFLVLNHFTFYVILCLQFQATYVIVVFSRKRCCRNKQYKLIVCSKRENLRLTVDYAARHSQFAQFSPT